VTVEIERKFILDQPPDAGTLPEGVPLRQGYIAVDGEVSVRIRITPVGAMLTIKAGSGLTRTEVELPLSGNQAEALWPGTARRRIDKTRYRVPLDGDGESRVAEVDVYEGALAGLCTVEVEFDSEAAATQFVPPPWFGRDVTDEQGWSNASLALHGVPR
jgi:adenylate cyclase